jgi:hypothetical protein
MRPCVGSSLTLLVVMQGVRQQAGLFAADAGPLLHQPAMQCQLQEEGKHLLQQPPLYPGNQQQT